MPRDRGGDQLWWRDDKGNVPLLGVLLIAVVAIAGGGLISASNHDMNLSNKLNGQIAARSMAELGAVRAMNLLRIAPLWRTDSPLEKEFELGNGTGSYRVTAQTVPDGELATGGYPLVQIVSIGRLVNRDSDVQRRIRTQVYVQPPFYLRPRLSLYRGFGLDPSAPGSPVLDLQGDLYVSGPFEHSAGRLCVEGDLIIHSYGPGTDPPEQRATCTGGNRVVTGHTSVGIDQDTFNDRPIYPVRWYRWAQNRIWNDLYPGKQRLDPSTMTFAQMVDEANSGQYPYGLMFLREGDLEIELGQYEISGQLTVVVNGTLTVGANKIEYSHQPGWPLGHLVLVSTNGIRFMSNGPFGALFYTYAPFTFPGEAVGENAGRVWFATPGGPDKPSGNVNILGTMAAERLVNAIGLWRIEDGGNQLIEGAAPAVPGMKIKKFLWEEGSP